MTDKRQQRFGESNGASVLTEAVVRSIRECPGSNRRIAVLFGIGKSTVGDIRSGKSWAWLK